MGAHTITSNRLNHIFNTLKNDRFIKSSDDIIKNITKEGFLARLKLFIDKILNHAPSLKHDMIAKFADAIIEFSMSTHKNIDDIKEPFEKLKNRIGLVNLDPGKLELTVGSDSKGMLCLGLKGIFPGKSLKFTLHTFYEDVAWLENNAENPPEEFSHLQDLFNIAKNHNSKVGVGDNSKTYVEAALESFSDIKDTHNKLKTKNPIYINFCGSGDNKSKADRHIFFHQKKVKNNCIVIDGPSAYRGKRFDRNIAKGFVKAAESLKAGHKSIILTGHSRGACEVVIVNNLLVAALNNDAEAAESLIPTDIKGKYREDMLDAIQLIISQQHTNIPIVVNLIDPVKGPISHSGFKYMDTLMVQNTGKDHDINIFRAINEHKAFFDIFLPSIESKERNLLKDNPLKLYSANAIHGAIVRSPNLKLDKKNGSYEGYALMSKVLDIPNTFNTKEHLIKQTESDYSLDVGKDRYHISLYGAYGHTGKTARQENK